jgi:hypothetical protein
MEACPIIFADHGEYTGVIMAEQRHNSRPYWVGDQDQVMDRSFAVIFPANNKGRGLKILTAIYASSQDEVVLVIISTMFGPCLGSRKDNSGPSHSQAGDAVVPIPPFPGFKEVDYLKDGWFWHANLLSGWVFQAGWFLRWI